MPIASELIASCQRLIAAGKNSAFLFLLPTTTLVEQAAHQVIAASPQRAVAGLPIHSFDAFIDRVIREAQRPLASLADREREVLLGGLVSEMAQKGELSYFTRIAELPGLAWSLANSIAELKMADVSPERLWLAVQDQGEKLLDLVAIYRAYQQLLERRGLMDKEDRYRLVADLLTDEPERYLASVELFLADQFYDLTPIQGVIFTAIAKYVDASRVHFGAMDASRPELAQILERSLLRLGQIQVEFSVPEAGGLRPSLDHLGEHLFRPTAPESDEVDGITVIEAPDPERELSQVAKAIKRRLLAGLKPWQVAVVVRDPAAYSQSMVKVFEREGIPYRMNVQAGLAENPLVQAVLMFLDSSRREPQGFSLERLLKCDLLMRDPRLAERVASLWPTVGLVGSWRQWLERLQTARERAVHQAQTNRVGDDDETERKVEVDTAFFDQGAALLTGLSAIMQLIPRSGRPSAISRGLLLALKRLGVEQNLRRGMLRRGDETGLRLLGRDFAAWKELHGLIDELPRTLALWSGNEPEITLADYISQLRQLGSSASYRLPSGHPAGVAVGSPSQLRGQEFELVCIIGLTDKSFPRSIRADWVIPDTVRQQLSRHGIVLDRSWDLWQREKLLFFLAASSARSELLLSYAATDAAGQSQVPSQFIHEVTRLFTPGALAYEVIGREQIFLADPWAATHQRELGQALCGTLRTGAASTLAASEAGEAARSELAALTAQLQPEHWRATWQRAQVVDRRQLPEPGEYDGLITDEQLLVSLAGEFGAKRTHSISSLGQYALCPFSYLCQRELGVEPLEEVDEELSPIAKGNLYHEILRRFFERYRGQSLVPEKQPDYLVEMQAIIDQLWSELPMQSPHPKLWELVRQRVEKEMERVIGYELDLVAQHQGLVQPRLLEWGFGLPTRDGMDPQSTDQPLVLTTEVGEIRIIGLIDRVDTSADGRVVVYDYKTGKPPEPKDLIEGLNLQLPVYLWAVEQLSPVGQQAVGAAFYDLRAGNATRGLWQEAVAESFKIHKRNAGRLTDPLWQELMASLRARIADYVSGMRQGRFTTTPRKSCPSYCSYKEICRYDPRRFAGQGEESEEVSPDA